MFFKHKPYHPDTAKWLQFALDCDPEKARMSNRNIIMRCPFHEERTPSFAIDPTLGKFHCYGCGKGGSLEELVEVKCVSQKK